MLELQAPSFSPFPQLEARVAGHETGQVGVEGVVVVQARNSLRPYISSVQSINLGCDGDPRHDTNPEDTGPIVSPSPVCQFL